MLRGSCLCGAVTYEIGGAPQSLYYCHCRDCQKANGASAATNIMVATADFAVTAGSDRLAWYESSPGKRRHFCSGCGSPIYSHAEKTKEVVSIRCGTLSDDPGLRPSFHIFVDSRPPWTVIEDGLPQFARGRG